MPSLNKDFRINNLSHSDLSKNNIVHFRYFFKWFIFAMKAFA